MEAGLRIALLGGRSDIEICARLSEKIKDSLNLCSNNELFQTAAAMRRCKAVVCNDSGLMHLACAVGVPVITIFGSSVREFGFAPYKCKNLILENKNLKCRPCSHIGRESCPKGHFKCMRDILPEQLLAAVTQLMQ